MLQRININCSKRESVKLHRSGRKILPAILNSLSTGADDDGTPSTSFANLDNLVYLFSFFQKSAGFVSIDTHGDSKYASSSIAQVDSIDGSLDCTGTGIKLNKDFALFGLGGSIGISSRLVSGDGDGTLFSSAVKMTLWTPFSQFPPNTIVI